jgi:hypothetical protein
VKYDILSNYELTSPDQVSFAVNVNSAFEDIEAVGHTILSPIIEPSFISCAMVNVARDALAQIQNAETHRHNQCHHCHGLYNARPVPQAISKNRFGSVNVWHHRKPQERAPFQIATTMVQTLGRAG